MYQQQAERYGKIADTAIRDFSETIGGRQTSQANALRARYDELGDRSDVLGKMSDRAWGRAGTYVRDIGGAANSGVQMRDRALGQNNLNQAAARTNLALGEAGQQLDFTGAAGLSNQALNEALARGDMNAAAGQAIDANQQLAQSRLGFSLGQQQNAAMGLARGQGEGGALAMQQALASAGVGAQQLAAQSNMTQAQLANDMRYQAARDQIANELAVAGTTSGRSYDAAINQQLQQLGVAQQQSQYSMGGAQQQAANSLGVADANAQAILSAKAQQASQAGSLYGQALGAQGQALGAQGQAMSGSLAAEGQLASTMGSVAGMRLGQQQAAQGNLMGMEAAAAGLSQADAQSAYQTAIDQTNRVMRVVKGSTDPVGVVSA
jgi:hypothetical protein